MTRLGSSSCWRDLLAGEVDRACLDPLARYAELLERWSRTHNLVRFASREELVRRHLLESLAATPLLAEAGSMLDVGSGAGLPGIPLLLARRGWRGLLLEPRSKRWAFLSLAIRELGLDAEVRAVRYDELDHGSFDAITARALGGYPRLVQWARGRLAPGGVLLIWTTEDGLVELSAVPGWRVLSSPLPASRRGRLAQLQPCST